ncbi:MAG TPA: PEP-utilizing enzyme, partial [Polyangium sp.]|nr:PEP-utilizing enzyme [Polyangium sp.]
VTYRALQALLRYQKSEDPAHHHVLLEGLDVAGAWSLRALWELARVVAANAGARAALARNVSTGGGEFNVFRDALDPDVRDKVDEWLDQFGFRGSGELLLTVPSLAEEPDRLLPLLHRYVELALAVDETSPGVAFARQKDARERMTAQYRRAFARPLRPLFDKLVGATQASVKFRERARFRQALLYSRLRAIALACGRTLVTSNQINQPDDVFFLTYAELLELMRQNWTNHLEPAELLRVRRAEHAEQSAFDVPDVFTLGHDQCLKFDDFHVGARAPDKPVADGVLVGVAASGGLVTGRAAVLDGLADADRLCRGDVLVARQTDPGWAPLFFLVKGLVLERGGMLSHGSILARELGIPSVVGVPQATSRITHGRNIAVDGNAGHVQCLE